MTANRSGDPVGAIDPALRADAIMRVSLRADLESMRDADALVSSTRRSPALSVALSEVAAAEVVAPGSVERMWAVVADARAIASDLLRSRTRARHERSAAVGPELLGRFWAMDSEIDRRRIPGESVVSAGT